MALDMKDDHERLTEAAKVLAESLDQLANKYTNVTPVGRVMRATATRSWELYHVLHNIENEKHR